MATPTPQQQTVSMTAILGNASTSNVRVSTFSAPTSWTAAYGLVSNVIVDSAASNFAVDLGALFPGLASINGIYVKEVTLVGVGFKVGFATADKMTIRASGFMYCSPNNLVAPLPRLYFDGLGVADANIEIGVFGN